MAKTGRPATGQTRIMGFRPPEPLRAEFEKLAKDQGRTPSDALIEAMHLWLDKYRAHPAQSPDAT